MKKKITTAFLFVSILIIYSCSSAPKRPLEIDVTRKQAEQELEMGNKAAGQGKYEHALLLLTEAKRKSISVDDHSLIVRTCIARGNVLLSVNRIDEAFLEFDAALSEARRSRRRSRELFSVASISNVRGLLLSGRDTPENVLQTIIREQDNVKDPYFTALTWQTRGLVLRAMGSYNDAESSIKRSLDIHLKNRYLENASTDWYIIASIRSLSGNYEGAIEALQESMEIDRRIENSYGLASSWKATGDVYTKMEREREARSAYRKAEDILKAIN